MLDEIHKLPTMWIKREITQIIESNIDYIQILTGPRQCGKSSLFTKYIEAIGSAALSGG